jgi:hypothetical protein
MNPHQPILLLGLLALAGCGSNSTSNTPSPLGRPLNSAAAPARQALSFSGDPPAERNGTIPQSQTAKQDTPGTGSSAPSPQAALRHYALIYTNWQATSLVDHERELASIAIGTARQASEQTIASQSATTELTANHVQNKGIVLAISPGEGPAHGQWVVVTQEQTTGTGPYAGLPASLHVTLARIQHLDRGWVVSSWIPRN